MARKKITDEFKEEIIEYYLSKPMSLDEVGNKFNLSLPTVINILRDVPKYKKAIIFNPDLEEHYFDEIDSEEKAYFLGLIIADGNVFIDKTGGNRQASISISLQTPDEYILENFKNELKSNTTVVKDKRGCSQIAVRSNILAEGLKKFGIVEKKSFNTSFPENINEKYIRHIVRGIFDGDGSFQYITGRKKEIHSFSFCGTHKLMEDLSNKICECINLNTKPSVYDYKNRNLSEIKIQSKFDVKSFGEWIYEDSTIFLTRKKDKFDLFISNNFGNTEVNI